MFLYFIKITFKKKKKKKRVCTTWTKYSRQSSNWLSSNRTIPQSDGFCGDRRAVIQPTQSWYRTSPHLTDPEIVRFEDCWLYGQSSISGTALSGRAYKREVFCAFLTRFTGRMCNVQRDFPVTGAFRVYFPSCLRNSTDILPATSGWWYDLYNCWCSNRTPS
jgi:hypothetical protein